MGGGSFSTGNYTTRRLSSASKSSSEIFASRSINNAMDPYNLTKRECLDTEEHPNTTPIIIALDVTGSMGSIPNHLVKEGLPKMMQTLIDMKIPDPQVLFIGIGDHECDTAPLQVGQFESSDELLEKWLTTVFLEGGGGGNDGESYLLAWHVAGYHTSIDSFTKRNTKGWLFTIGDEPTLKHYPSSVVKRIMGGEQHSSYSADELLSKAMEQYNVYHIHTTETRSGSNPKVYDGWKQLIGDGLLRVNRKEEIPTLIAQTIIDNTIKNTSDILGTPQNNIVNSVPPIVAEEILL